MLQNASEPGEQAILFGTGRRLVGIVTMPQGTTAAHSDTAVILLNAGVVHRVGPNRLYVTLARRLSRAGYTVLRFDHAGIGDSLPREDQLNFSESSVVEAQEAMDWLSTECRCRGFVLLGLCSGTLTAFRVAQRDARVSGLILLTALLQDPAGVPPEIVAEATDRRIARSHLTEKLTSGRSWRKLLRGASDPARIWKTLERLVKRPPPVRTDAAADVASNLERILRRGVSVLFVYGEPTTVLEYFRMTIAPLLSGLRRQGRIEVAVLKRADHTFSELRDQQRVIDLVIGWLER
jgi:pimeloyl-ACP methyl ester carboxylesterase